LLHLGCGGGHLDRSLKETFAITGVDTSEEMLALARRLNPEVEYVRGDLRTLDLGRSFDAVAVFDSIDYMLREADLRRAFETAWRHLRPGGVFLTYAERSLERFVPDRTRASTRSAGDVTITLIEHEWDPDPGDSTFETTFVYFIRRGKTLSIETDRHMMGLFPLASWWRTLQQVGFDVIQVESTEAEPGEPGVPWFVCVKPG
jgi:SAM-dependent methyltransferase